MMYAIVATHGPWCSWQARFSEEQSHLWAPWWELGLHISTTELDSWGRQKPRPAWLTSPPPSPPPGGQGWGNPHLLRLTPRPPARALGCGAVNDSHEVVHWPLAKAGGGSLPLAPGCCLLGSDGHAAWPTLQDRFSFLFLLPPFCCLSLPSLPLFVPLPLACSLKLACGAQGQTFILQRECAFSLEIGSSVGPGGGWRNTPLGFQGEGIIGNEITGRHSSK